MQQTILGKPVTVSTTTNLYKWAKTWGKVQKSYYPYEVSLRREKQIKDFLILNEFHRPFVIKDTDVLKDVTSETDVLQADIMVITDQKFSRLPCLEIVRKVNEYLDRCSHMLLCLNRHYVNIDSSYCDTELDQHFPLAITQWLKKNLPDTYIVDMSLDVLDRGDWFTWVIPDRIYYLYRL